MGQQHLHIGDVVVDGHPGLLGGWERSDDEVAVVQVGGLLITQPCPGEQGHLPGGVGVDVAVDVHGEHEHRPSAVRDAHRCRPQRRHEDHRVGGQPFLTQQRCLVVGWWRRGMRTGHRRGSGRPGDATASAWVFMVVSLMIEVPWWSSIDAGARSTVEHRGLAATVVVRARSR
ncbi:hypothetical protein [Actinokineospora spheciospongiae]|uniref:hypothetical protein n=1 Tax=Actinokineospora spheciospongiae TaxID=909613 RepID=UPI0015E85EA0|nr:hypothetical protein [Actinokineospora spheciospongiae]